MITQLDKPSFDIRNVELRPAPRRKTTGWANRYLIWASILMMLVAILLAQFTSIATTYLALGQHANTLAQAVAHAGGLRANDREAFRFAMETWDKNLADNLRTDIELAKVHMSAEEIVPAWSVKVWSNQREQARADWRAIAYQHQLRAPVAYYAQLSRPFALRLFGHNLYTFNMIQIGMAKA